MTRLAILLILAASSGGAGGEIDWQPDLASARNLARAEGKPLVLYFTFDT